MTKALESLGVTLQLLKSLVAFCSVCRNGNPSAAGNSWTSPQLLCSSQGTLREQEAIPFLRLPPGSLQSGKRHLTHEFELKSLKCTEKKAATCMCPSEQRSLSEQWELYSPHGFYVRNINISKTSFGMAQKREAVGHETEQKWESRHCTPVWSLREGFLW